MGYISKYNRDHYRRIWVRRSTFSRLVEVCDKPIMDCVDELIEAVDLPNKLFDELKKHFISKFNKAKHVRYIGGDWRIKEELINIALRVPVKKATFVEVFGGSGVMSQFVPRSKFPNVIYNDIDRDLTALHKLAKEKTDLLASVLSLLPYSRYVNKYMSENFAGQELGGLIGASILFYLLSSSFSGIVDAGFSTTKVPGSSVAGKYMSHVVALYEVAKRFRDVTIECLDFEELIEKYDSDSTLFYLDPPYLSVGEKDRDYYRHGFTKRDASRLVNALKHVKGYFMLKVHEDNEAFYKSIPIVDRVEIESKLSVELVINEKRREFNYVVLTNYRVSTPTLSKFSSEKI
ncbi:MAG: DNA adenine methylase [Desulfurococcaceae archaeon]